MEKGKIKFSGKSKREIKLDKGGEFTIPTEFELDKETHNGKSCEFLREGGKLISLVVDGVSIEKDAAMLQKKAELEAQKAAEANAKEKEKQREREAEQQAIRNQQQNRGGNQQGNQTVQAFSIDNAKLPEDTKRVLNESKNFSKGDIDNFALRLHKLVNFWSENNYKPTLYQLKKGKKINGIRTPDVLMRHTLPDVAHPEYGKTNFDALTQRQEHTAALLFPEKECIVIQKHKVSGRLVLGIGSASVFETGFTLHHVYGIPYIPASSIKGVVRSWIITEAFDGNEGDALADPTFCDMFGCPGEWQKDKNSPKYPSYYKKDKDSGERIGNIVFMDAYPTAPPKVVEDVMDVHYKDYYGGTAAPTDFQPTNPIHFLTVEGGEFQFILGFKPLQGKEGANATGNIATWLGKQNGEISLLEAAKLSLIKALTEHGIGAKTAVGYGFFEKSNNG